MSLEDTLKLHYGYDQFRPNQKEIIEAFLDSRDVFVMMATGSGKSLCYQVPALFSGKPVMVVSPLISLMKDQVAQLQQNGISACLLNNSIKLSDLMKGKYQVIYITPERISRYLAKLNKLNLVGIAIDESHCVSEWGHDFRPTYRELNRIRDFYQGPIMALTATATTDVVDDIIKCLNLEDPLVIQTTFNRPNLTYRVKKWSNPEYDIEPLIGQDPTIIYCTSRKMVDQIHRQLGDNHKVSKYHAGMTPKQRESNHNDFLNEETITMVATVAYGMGINKSNIRRIIHVGIPKMIETYYQQTGRAGRDGLPSECIMYYSNRDFKMVNFYLKNIENEKIRMVVKDKIYKMHNYVGFPGCRRQYILNYFDESLTEQCTGCDYCSREKEYEDCTDELELIFDLIKETDGKISIKHLPDVLQGKSDKWKWTDSYGQGRFHSRQGWLDIVRRAHQYVKVVKYGKLVIIKEDDEILLVKPEKKTDMKASLEDLRRKIAKENKVPPHAILSDVSIMDMIAKRPKDIVQLMDINGISAQKAFQYGEEFIKLM